MYDVTLKKGRILFVVKSQYQQNKSSQVFFAEPCQKAEKIKPLWVNIDATKKHSPIELTGTNLELIR